MNTDFNIDLHTYNSIVFFTGAGLSAESGIPTYRGQNGIWKKYNYEEFACQRAFDRDPEKVWKFHDERRRFIHQCNPSEGHKIIAAIEHEKPETAVITQNIDGLHQKAGSKNVIELHGSIWRVRCDNEGLIFDDYSFPAKRRCKCKEYLRPDIVWFGDPLKQDEILNAVSAIQNAELLISIGTSGTVYPAAELPFIAMNRGILVLK